MSETWPPGTVTGKQYDVPVPTGGTANFAFTLGDNKADTIQARFAQQTGALAYGLVSFGDGRMGLGIP
jgi:hypothetical protein